MKKVHNTTIEYLITFAFSHKALGKDMNMTFLPKLGACHVISFDSAMGGRSSTVRRQLHHFCGEIRFGGPG